MIHLPLSSVQGEVISTKGKDHVLIPCFREIKFKNVDVQ